MDLGLAGQLVIVTGSTQGIGFSIASGFAKHGARVVVNGRSQATTDSAKARLIAQTGAKPQDVFAIAGDLSKKEAFDHFVVAVDAIGQPVEVLVNNHGIYEFKDFFVESDDKWEEYWQVNVMAQVRLTRRYLKGMLERKHGRVLFSSSLAGLGPVEGAVGYSVSKTAQISLARALSELTKGTQVTVNSVIIGPTLTEGVRDAFGAAAKANNISFETVVAGFLAKDVPAYKLDRLEDPDEIAQVFLFLASKHGIVINGVAQLAEGGALRHI